MYCIKCGKKNNDEDKFCTKCGNKIGTEPKKQEQKEKADGKAIASLVLGMISLLLVFTFSILISPIYITGLILGIASKTKCSERSAGIILNIISIAVSIIVLIILIVLILIIGMSVSDLKDFNTDYKYAENVSYSCKMQGEDNYSVSLYLSEDNSFEWSKYDDDSVSIYGTYRISNVSDNTYNLELNSYGMVNDGINSEYKLISNYEMKIEDFVYLTRVDTDTKYICEKNNNYFDILK